LLLCISVVTHAEMLDVDALLDRLVETYGGEANLHKLSSQVQLWDEAIAMAPTCVPLRPPTDYESS
jgi:hypothetical protein